MRNCVHTIIAVCVLITVSCKGFSQTAHTDSTNHNMDSREEAFGRQVFAAFQTHNDSLYAALQPTNEEYKVLLQRMLAANVEGLTQAKIDGMMARRKKEATARMKADFADYQTQAAKAGIAWEKAVYQSYDSQEIYPEEIHQKYIMGALWFAVNGTRYLIEDVQAVDIPEGYKLQRILRIRKAEDVD